jgi:hypothetical protein
MAKLFVNSDYGENNLQGYIYFSNRLSQFAPNSLHWSQMAMAGAVYWKLLMNTLLWGMCGQFLKHYDPLLREIYILFIKDFV